MSAKDKTAPRNTRIADKASKGLEDAKHTRANESQMSKTGHLIQHKGGDTSDLPSKFKEADIVMENLKSCFDYVRNKYEQYSEEHNLRKEEILKLQEQLVHSNKLVKQLSEDRETEVNDLKKQLGKVRSECDIKLAEKDATLEEYQKRLEESIKDGLKQKQEQKQKYENIHKQLETNVEALKEKRKKILDEAKNKFLDMVKETKEKSEQKIQEAHSELGSLKKCIHEDILQNKSQAVVEPLIQKMNEAQSQTETEMMSFLKNLEFHAVNHQTEIEDLKGTYESKITDMEDKISKLESQIKRQTDQISETESHNGQVIESFLNEIRYFYDQVKELQWRDQCKEEELEKLKKRFGELSSQLQDTQKCLSEALEEKKQLQSSVSSYNYKIKELKELLSEETTKNTSLQEQLKELETSLKKERNERASFGEGMSKKTQEHEKDRKICYLENCLKSAEEKTDRLEKELTEQKKQTSGLQSEFSDKRAMLKERLDDWTRKMQTAQSNLDLTQDASQKVINLKSELNGTRKKLSVKAERTKILLKTHDKFREKVAQNQLELKRLLLQYMTGERTRERAMEIAAKVEFEEEEVQRISNKH